MCNAPALAVTFDLFKKILKVNEFGQKHTTAQILPEAKKQKGDFLRKHHRQTDGWSRSDNPVPAKRCIFGGIIGYGQTNILFRINPLSMKK
jgi:hypothetical protein